MKKLFHRILPLIAITPMLIASSTSEITIYPKESLNNSITFTNDDKFVRMTFHNKHSINIKVTKEKTFYPIMGDEFELSSNKSNWSKEIFYYWINNRPYVFVTSRNQLIDVWDQKIVEHVNTIPKIFTLFNKDYISSIDKTNWPIIITPTKIFWWTYYEIFSITIRNNNKLQLNAKNGCYLIDISSPTTIWKNFSNTNICLKPQIQKPPVKSETSKPPKVELPVKQQIKQTTPPPLSRKSIIGISVGGGSISIVALITALTIIIKKRRK